VTDAQWGNIKKYLDKTGRRRQTSLRSVWNALMYLLKTGCQWRMLPDNFPKWQTGYYYFRKWVEDEVLDRVLDMARAKVRVGQGQQAQPTLGVMDSQSVRWGNNRSLKGYDGNKRVKGVKRHVVVDKNGFLVAVMVTAACINDGKAALLLMRVQKDCYASIRTVLADGGYRGDIIAAVKSRFSYLLQVVMRPRKDSGDGFRPMHRRWMVERTFSWFDNDRRLPSQKSTTTT
ncbi:MAG: IS5 family transposase, partial [Chitinophagaceae bacterium]